MKKAIKTIALLIFAAAFLAACGSKKPAKVEKPTNNFTDNEVADAVEEALRSKSAKRKVSEIFNVKEANVKINQESDIEVTKRVDTPNGSIFAYFNEIIKYSLPPELQEKILQKSGRLVCIEEKNSKGNLKLKCFEENPIEIRNRSFSK